MFYLQEKCFQYWPHERSVRYQCYVVDPIAEYNMPQYKLREFKVRLKNKLNLVLAQRGIETPAVIRFDSQLILFNNLF